ncbi:hypothetical protein V8C44DRAFT_340706 [Trichoderma aethiopicum]
MQPVSRRFIPIPAIDKGMRLSLAHPRLSLFLHVLLVSALQISIASAVIVGMHALHAQPMLCTSCARTAILSRRLTISSSKHPEGITYLSVLASYPPILIRRDEILSYLGHCAA